MSNSDKIIALVCLMELSDWLRISTLAYPWQRVSLNLPCPSTPIWTRGLVLGGAKECHLHPQSFNIKLIGCNYNCNLHEYLNITCIWPVDTQISVAYFTIIRYEICKITPLDVLDLVLALSQTVLY